MDSLATRRMAALVACAPVAAAILLAAGCEVTDVGPAPAQAQDDEDAEGGAEQQDPPTALDCFLEVRQRTTLNDLEALELCRGSRSLGPYQCFREARRKTPLQDPLRIQLCRCAEGAAPVRCYRRFKREALLDDVSVVSQCRPIVTRRLTDACIPIRYLL